MQFATAKEFPLDFLAEYWEQAARVGANRADAVVGHGGKVVDDPLLLFRHVVKVKAGGAHTAQGGQTPRPDICTNAGDALTDPGWHLHRHSTLNLPRQGRFPCLTIPRTIHPFPALKQSQKQVGA